MVPGVTEDTDFKIRKRKKSFRDLTKIALFC